MPKGKPLVVDSSCPWKRDVMCKKGTILKALKRSFARKGYAELIKTFNLTDCQDCVFKKGTIKDEKE